MIEQEISSKCNSDSEASVGYIPGFPACKDYRVRLCQQIYNFFFCELIPKSSHSSKTLLLNWTYKWNYCQLAFLLFCSINVWNDLTNTLCQLIAVPAAFLEKKICIIRIDHPSLAIFFFLYLNMITAYEYLSCSQILFSEYINWMQISFSVCLM